MTWPHKDAIGESWPDALIIRIVKQSWLAQHAKSFTWIIIFSPLGHTEGRYYCYLHFTEKEPGLYKLSHLPKVTQHEVETSFKSGQSLWDVCLSLSTKYKNEHSEEAAF